ncbi:hypothetical protein NQD34_008283 [Periophthalmus magnuspinnatus]|nr:hypothetical protein NQD34_008283 [Periophthalmus magnuspinnatus]
MKSSGGRPSRIPLNPFVHEVKLSSAQKIQFGLMSVTVFPVRLVLAVAFMVLAWAFCYVGALGRSKSVLGPKTWRTRFFDFGVRKSMRAMWFFCGFHWVKVKGQRADPSDAPILVMAPHSAYFDAIPVSETLCTFVTKESGKEVPLWRSIIEYVRPVYVLRGDQDSRKRTVEEIKRRVTSGEPWPQLMIFPEGTCTNRIGLILFKAGSFIPGLPVQPVVLRYPNPLDTVTWAWQGPGGLKILWLTLCQFHNSLEIEYLPVYNPSEEEKKNPALFAENVRKLMAKALELPLIDLAFDDCDITVSEGPLRIFNFSSLLEFNQMVVRLGLKGSTNPAVLGRQAEEARRLRGEGLTVEDFAQRLGLSVSDKLRQVHGVFDQTEDGLIDYRRYVIALSTVYQPKKTKETLKLAFKMYQDEDDGSVTEEDLAAILEIMLGVEKVDLSGLFLSLQEETGKITYDELCDFIDKHPDFTQNYIRFKNHPSAFCFSRERSSSSKDQKKRD